jgi:hypothetical protein
VKDVVRLVRLARVVRLVRLVRLARRCRTTRRLAAPFALLLAVVVAGGPWLACVPPGGPRAPATPTDPDAQVVFESLRAARTRMGARPPSWVGRLDTLARRGATDLAQGKLGQSVASDIGSKAAYTIGRNVETWWFITDDLHNIDWPPRMLSGRSLLVSLGVALMQTTAPGRYAVLAIMPEPGPGLAG